MKKDKLFRVLLGGVILLTVTLSSYVALAQTTVAYVVNNLSDDVSVIDTSTNTVIVTIPVGDGPQRVAFTPDGSRAYVTNFLDDNVSVIDTLTNTEIDVDGDPNNGITRIPVGTFPIGIEVSPDGTKVYVANEGSDDISVIDTATNIVSPPFAVVGGINTPHAPAFTPDGSEVWVSGGAGNSISRFAFSDNMVLGLIGGVIGAAERIKFLLDGSFAFVNNGCGACGNLQKISTVSNSVVATLSFGSAGAGLAIAPDGSAVYAGTGFNGGRVHKINPNTLGIIFSAPTPSFPLGIAVTPDGNTLYAANPAAPAGEVYVIDTSTMTVQPQTIAVGSSPIDIAITTLAPLSPTSYDMLNGNNENFAFLDRSYDGSGDPTQPSSFLSDGLGDLADGIIATQNFFDAEPASGPPANGPYVGWDRNKPLGLNPTITFNFGCPATIDSITVHADDADTGGVDTPSSVDISMGVLSQSFAFPDPAGTDPVSATFSLSLATGTSLVLTANHKSQWVFLSEVTFEGSCQVPPSEVVLFATDSIAIGDDILVLSGDIVVNNATGPLTIKKNGDVTGNLKADLVGIKNGTVINGAVFTNTLTNEGGMIFGGTSSLTLPVFATLPPVEPVDRDPGAPDAIVGKNNSIVLAAGDYDEIKADDGATVTFTGGTYQIRTVVAKNNTSFLFEAPTTLVIEQPLTIAKDGFFGPAAGANVTAAGIIAYVGGSKAAFGERNEIRANIYAHSGAITMKVDTTAEGAFLAKTMNLGSGVTVALDSFLDFQ